MIAVGVRVVILAGRLAGVAGEVSAVIRETSCGCSSLIVRTTQGEWFGKATEVRAL